MEILPVMYSIVSKMGQITFSQITRTMILSMVGSKVSHEIESDVSYSKCGKLASHYSRLRRLRLIGECETFWVYNIISLLLPQ